ncbi:hypothetical protein PNOK_0578100 [Pyrrhoderma noxium]|uniref:Uncharacterized protein n=1 Tax=Pyrrhoderma noxium TaxID=2282107 RepID=A0A286UHC2_9AGAM|nr:hypothetical protein PNOK_0578100 [Pyrrhoderma noxium]
MNTTMNTTMNRGLTIIKLKRKRCSTIADPRYSGPGASRFTAASAAAVTTSTVATAFTSTTPTTNPTSTSVLNYQVADRARERREKVKRCLGLGIEPGRMVKRRRDIYTGTRTETGTGTILESEELGLGGSSEARSSKRLRRHSRNQSQNQSTRSIQVGVYDDIMDMKATDTSRRGDTDTLDLSATSEKTLVDVGQDESHSGETRVNSSRSNSKSGVSLSSSRLFKPSLICGCTCTTHENFDNSTSHELDIIGTLKRRLYGSCAQLVASRAREREVQKRLEVQEWKFGIMKKRYEKVRKDNELLMKKMEELKKLEGNRKRRMEEVIEEEQEKLVVEILLEVD